MACVEAVNSHLEEVLRLYSTPQGFRRIWGGATLTRFLLLRTSLNFLLRYQIRIIRQMRKLRNWNVLRYHLRVCLAELFASECTSSPLFGSCQIFIKVRSPLVLPSKSLLFLFHQIFESNLESFEIIACVPHKMF